MKTMFRQQPRLWLLCLAACALGIVLAGWAVADSILNTKHDLSASGPGPIRAKTETEVCLFCHTPHRSSGEAPLWNRYDSGATYIPYSSTTVKAAIGQPTGASKLCLSCHDGTVALGMVRSRASSITFENDVIFMPPGSTNLGTNLSDDHPISFTYDPSLAAAHGQLKDPALLTGRVRLDKNEQLQCTSCHDPHDNQFGKFLVVNNQASALCVTCHAPTGWDSAAHRTSNAVWNGQPPNPWPHTQRTTVAANACENCHTSHNAGTPARLMVFAGEEQNCFSCHNGHVASKNLQTEFNKFSVHPILNTTGVHDPMEDPINPARHVECLDCHNPHAARNAPAAPPNASGALAGVLGVTIGGATTRPLTNEYELCFRCHADSANRGPARVPRQFVQTNTRLEFHPSNASYHPVVATGKNPNVPSLISPWTTNSLVYCTDCHNNNEGPGAGGGGPKGPHGSAFLPILERQLVLTNGSDESPANYDLCYKCHSRTSILNDESFKEHSRHIVNAKTACTTCHDPHGVVDKTHLINFNTNYVTTSDQGLLQFVDEGLFRGNCSLKCHNKNHNASSYAP